MSDEDVGDGCGQTETGTTKVDWKGTSAIIMKSSSSVHVFTVFSFLLLNGSCALDLKDCMKTCINQKGFPIPSQCPNNKACDWLCEAYYKNCSGNTKYHCAKINGTGKYTRECALPVTCTQGTEPVITMASGSPVVSCLPCPDKMYYNSAKNLSSDNFSNCQEKKHNQCTAEFKKKDCGQERGQKRWDEQSISDGFCRCDARNGYAPFDDSSLFKEEYCFTRAENCRKVYCDIGMELSLNYVCIPKCPDGLNRTELSDECKNLTGWTTTSPIPNITATRPSTEPATASPPKPITTSNKTDTLPDNNSSQKTDIGIISGIVVVVVVFIVTTGVVCYCCKERLDQLRCQLCQLCGTARSQGTKAEYFQVPTDPSGTIGNHKIDCSINIVTEGTKNGEANGTTNHVGDSQNTVDLVNEHPNNENDNNSAGDDQTEATGSTERKGRKKKGSRHKEENNKPIINNYNIKVKIEGNQNNYHIGSASQVEGLDLNLIEETAEALCSNNNNKSKANDQEVSGSEDTEMDSKNNGTEESKTDTFGTLVSSGNGASDSTEQTGNNLTQNAGTADETFRKTIVTDFGDGHISNAASDNDVSSNNIVEDSYADCSPGIVEEINVEENYQEADETSAERKNVENREDIVKYAESEWSRNNKRACVLTKAYARVKDHYLSPYIRVIRGNNYCAIRSTIFQILVNCFPPSKDWSSSDTAASEIKSYFSKGVLRNFKFAKRRTSPFKDWTELVTICLKECYEMAQKLAKYTTNAERQQILAEALNSDSDCDLNIMEAVKLLMAQCAINLHGDKERGKDVPEWAKDLLFARDGSKTVEQFISNHLNKVGHECGLEQVEMCLLGYSLGVCIRVLRLIHLNKVDFEVFYPPEGKDVWPVVTIISEDDRHYNVLVE